MKTLLLTCLFLTVAFAQTGRNVVLSWTDPNVGLTGQTYSVYRAPGLCSGTPAFSKIASGVTTKTYTDVNTPIGTYCYAATVTASGIESAQSVATGATVGPQAVTGLSVVVQ